MIFSQMRYETSVRENDDQEGYDVGRSDRNELMGFQVDGRDCEMAGFHHTVAGCVVVGRAGRLVVDREDNCVVVQVWASDYERHFLETETRKKIQFSNFK